LKLDPENIQILRDLSLLQIHRRDLTGFAETRRKLMQVKPTIRLNWIGYAIAEHLCKNYEFGWTCLEDYEKMFRDVKDERVTDYERSELFMYKASIMEEAGCYEDAITCLSTHENEIVDKLGLLKTRARLFLFLQRYEEAGELFKELVQADPEDHHHVLAYMSTQPKFRRFWPAIPPPNSLKTEGGGEPVLPSTLSSFPQTLHPEAVPVWGWLLPAQVLKSKRRVALVEDIISGVWMPSNQLCRSTKGNKRMCWSFLRSC